MQKQNCQIIHFHEKSVLPFCYRAGTPRAVQAYAETLVL